MATIRITVMARTIRRGMVTMTTDERTRRALDLTGA